MSKLKDAGIDVVYLGGYHTEAGIILRQMRAQGLGALMVSGDAWSPTSSGPSPDLPAKARS